MLPVIAGTLLGQLDSTQPARLLRDATCTITFATFDPQLARKDIDTSMPDLNELRLQQDFRIPKRIVIETDRTGSSRWRWVPHAIMEEGVENDGVWPAEVEFCGYATLWPID